MEATLARIDALNLRFNAIVALRDPEQLLEEASARDAELARGERLGWTHGFPLAVKDLSHAAGLPTSMGSPLSPRTPARTDSLHVARMRQAGAIVIGKTNTPEFGLGSHTYNTVFGITRNAWQTERSAGGSSGGAAVALALGMLPVADGSDMGGSLRNWPPSTT
jgi:amidase